MGFLKTAVLYVTSRALGDLHRKAEKDLFSATLDYTRTKKRSPGTTQSLVPWSKSRPLSVVLNTVNPGDPANSCYLGGASSTLQTQSVFSLCAEVRTRGRCSSLAFNTAHQEAQNFSRPWLSSSTASQHWPCLHWQSGSSLEPDSIKHCALVSSHVKNGLPRFSWKTQALLLLSQGLSLPDGGFTNPRSPGISCNSV